MKKVLLSLWAGMLILTLAACGNGQSNSSTQTPNSDSGQSNSSTQTENPDSAQPSAKPIKIGAIFSATGGAAPLGKSEMDTMKMVVEQMNQNGGIDGQPIELVAYDDKSDQNEAVLSMKKAISQDQVVAVIGGTTSGNALAMLPLAEKEKIPFIAVASSKQIHKPDDGSSRNWIFKIPPGDDVAVGKVLQYLKEQGIKKVAWLNVANSFGSNSQAEFKKHHAEYGIEVVIEETFEATVNDAKPMLTRVKKSNPEAIIVWGTAQESAVVMKNIRELGIEAPIVGSHAIGTKQLIELSSGAANGVVFPAGRMLVVDQLSDNHPQKQVLSDYKKSYETKYNKPADLYGCHPWDAMNMIVQAIKNSGAESDKIRDYLENNIKNFVGTNGIFNMSPSDHNGLTIDSLVMVEIKDGHFLLKEKE